MFPVKEPIIPAEREKLLYLTNERDKTINLSLSPYSVKIAGSVPAKPLIIKIPIKVQSSYSYSYLFDCHLFDVVIVQSCCSSNTSSDYIKKCSPIY